MDAKNTSNHIKLTPERGIEKLWKKTHDRIFGPQEKSEKTRKKINKKMQIINVAYALAKLKFEGKYRKISKEWYFEHLRETAYILIGSGIAENVTIYQVVVALLHDVIEDTNMSYDGLVEALSDSISVKLAERIASGIQGLTKKNWHKYIVSKSERDFVEYYETITNKNYHPETGGLFSEEKSVTKEEHEKYNEIKKRAKGLRDIDYICQIEELDDETLEVKFADRLHNLRTQWDPNNKEQVEKKVRETKLFYIPLAKKRNSTAYNLLRKEIKKLEIQLGYSIKIDEQLDITKEWTRKALESKS